MVQAVQYWESGRANPSIKYLPSIINFLGYSPFSSVTTLAEQLIQRRKLLGLSRKKRQNFWESIRAIWRAGKAANIAQSKRQKSRLRNLLVRILKKREGGSANPDALER
jgi:hypothetical protein